MDDEPFTHYSLLITYAKTLNLIRFHVPTVLPSLPRCRLLNVTR
jgi:hypothetical protein